MINQTNFKAYSEKGKLANFKNEQEIGLYRQQQISKHLPCLNFINDLFKDKKINVTEIGSGFSSLLYALQNKGILNKGFGFEQAQASYDFAQLWKIDYSYDRVLNTCGNAAVCNLPEDNDLFVIIDSTFPLLEPENKDYPDIILNKANASLKKDGILLMEVTNFSPFVWYKVNSNIWQEFPKTDAFRYGLYKKTLVDNFVECETVYISKTGKISKKKEIARWYTLGDMRELLYNHNFELIDNFSTFNKDPFIPEKSEKLIITARRK
jgi:hypothetical protein